MIWYPPQVALDPRTRELAEPGAQLTLVEAGTDTPVQVFETEDGIGSMSSQTVSRVGQVGGFYAPEGAPMVIDGVAGDTRVQITSYAQFVQATEAARDAAEGAKQDAATAAEAAETTAATVPNGFKQTSPSAMVPARDGVPVEGADPINLPRVIDADYEDLDGAMATQLGMSGSQSGGVLHAAIAEVSDRSSAFPTAVLFGSSSEAGNGSFDPVLLPGTSMASVRSSRGWAVWMNYYCGARFTITHNAGVGGQNYGQLRARIDSDVIAYEPDWVFMGYPGNDFASDRTADDVIADAEYMLDRLYRTGIRVLLRTGNGHTGIDTAERRSAFATWRAWAVAQNGRRGVVVADMWPLLADPATYAPRPGTDVDGVHFSLMGAQIAGRAAAQAISAAMPSIGYPNLLRSEHPSLIANPGFRGGGAGWSASGSGGTVAAAYPGDGSALLDISGYTATQQAGIVAEENIAAGRFQEGDVVQVTARLRWTAFVPLTVPSAPAPLVRIRTRNASGTTVQESFPMLQASGDHRVVSRFPEAGEMILSTVPVEILEGVNRVSVLVGFAHAASVLVKIEDVQVSRLNEPGDIAPTITTESLNSLTQGVAFNQTLSAAGTAPISWTVSAGSLPAGLAMSNAGVLSGTPTNSGAYSFTVQASNTAGSTTRAYSGTVASGAEPGLNLTASGSYAYRTPPSEMQGLAGIVVRHRFLPGAIPAGTGGHVLLDLKNAAGTGNVLRFTINGSGFPAIMYQRDGVGGLTTAISTATIDPDARGVAVERGVTASGHVRFYQTLDGAAWTQLGTTVTASGGALEPAASQLQIVGPRTTVTRTEIRDAAEAVILDQDWTAGAAGWTLAGGAVGA